LGEDEELERENEGEGECLGEGNRVEEVVVSEKKEGEGMSETRPVVVGEEWWLERRLPAFPTWLSI